MIKNSRKGYFMCIEQLSMKCTKSEKNWFDRRPKRRSFLDALIPTPTPSPRPSQENRRLEQLAAKTVPQESGGYYINWSQMSSRYSAIITIIIIM